MTAPPPELLSLVYEYLGQNNYNKTQSSFNTEAKLNNGSKAGNKNKKNISLSDLYDNYIRKYGSIVEDVKDKKNNSNSNNNNNKSSPKKESSSDETDSDSDSDSSDSSDSTSSSQKTVEKKNTTPENQKKLKSKKPTTPTTNSSQNL
jgi:hypothetical protein